MIREFKPERALEVIQPKYGSAYRIGGRLVLTAAHLLAEVGSVCCVRSKKSFGVTEAKVVWKASQTDIALIELPESIDEACEALIFGLLPETNRGENLKFQMYGWPRWGRTQREGCSAAGGRQVEGKIYLADTSPDGLLVLEAQRLPPEPPPRLSSEISSEWEGFSGAAIVCDGLVIAVQSQHQNPKRPASLEASPLWTIYSDEQWCGLLSQHGIDPKPETVRLDISVEFLERMRRHFVRQITKEKNSKKYIPDIFVEIAEIKDEARYFSHPTLFFQKVIDEIDNLNFIDFNRIFQKISLQPISLNWEKPSSSQITIESLQEHITVLKNSLMQTKEVLHPYSHDGEESRDPIDVPSPKKYVYEEIKYKLRYAANFLIRRINNLVSDLDFMSSRILFFIARAGQGKTNFVCDFAETVLLKRDIPCIYFTGHEFNHVKVSEIGQHFFKSVFGDRVEGMEQALSHLSNLARDLDKPIIIIIDGINEHKNIQAFSHHLEKLVEKILEYKFLKIIFTCRSEYFEERFKNFKQSSFSNEIQFVDNLGQYMSKMHKDRMVSGYFHFFNLRYPYISKRAYDILENDTLLLRMFCEAYGDVNSDKIIQLPQIFDIYREKVFREYLTRKIEGASEYEADSSRLQIGASSQYKKVLRKIIQLMLERKQYSDIAVTDLPIELHHALSSLLGEDMIVRKDLADIDDVLDEKIEVINFTFDEFRDFLLANHLVNIISKTNIREFEEIVDRILAPKSPVAEGIRTYLFFASRHPNSRNILDILRIKNWYDEIFIRSIFSVEEDFITQEDLSEIKSKFYNSKQNTSWIFQMLIFRWRSTWYHRLNINLLFEIIDGLNELQYNQLFKEYFKASDSYGSNGNQSSKIKELANSIKSLVDNEDYRNDKDFNNLMKLLIYLFPVREGWSYSSPTFDAFTKFAKAQPDAALILLNKFTQAQNIEIRTQVWRMLTYLIRLGEVPIELGEEACEFLLENSENYNSELAELAKEIVRFLETYSEEKCFWYEDSVVEQMKQYTSRPNFYERIRELIDDTET